MKQDLVRRAHHCLVVLGELARIHDRQHELLSAGGSVDALELEKLVNIHEALLSRLDWFECAFWAAIYARENAN